MEPTARVALRGEALDAAGEAERAGDMRGGAEAFMASLGCVNPL